MRKFMHSPGPLIPASSTLPLVRLGLKLRRTRTRKTGKTSASTVLLNGETRYSVFLSPTRSPIGVLRARPEMVQLKFLTPPRGPELWPALLGGSSKWMFHQMDDDLHL